MKEIILFKAIIPEKETIITNTRVEVITTNITDTKEEGRVIRVEEAGEDMIGKAIPKIQTRARIILTHLTLVIQAEAVLFAGVLASKLYLRDLQRAILISNQGNPQ